MMFLFALSMCAAHARAESPNMRLRIDWGGSRSIWHGTIAVERGEITEFRALGIEADEVGSMWLDKGQVHIQQRSPRTYDGIDLAITAPLDAKLIINLSPADRVAEAQTIEFPLSDLVNGYQESQLDDQGNRLVARRAPGDKLRVRLANSSLVLAPGEPITYELTPHLLGENVTGNVEVQTQVLSARGERSWSVTSQTVQAPVAGQQSPAIAMQVIAPREEGSYDLVITASQPKPRRGLAQVNPLADTTTQIAERKIQFVVLAKTPPAIDSTASAPTNVVDEIKPSGQWWERVAKLQHIPHIPGLKQGPLTNGEVQKWTHAQHGQLTAIGASPEKDERHWVAYPIDVKQPGQVHVLEVEYPIDEPQDLSISILEPNASGDVVPASLDSGVHVPKHAAGETNKLGVHRIIFWPRSESPIVLLTNPSRKRRSAFGRIRVLGPKQQGAPLLRIGSAARSRLPKAENLPPADSGRMVAAYLQQPLLPENFSASEALDAPNGRSLDDWVTFYEGSSRAVRYLQHVGYNTLVISALSSGSTLYPSQFLQPTPRFDTGDFFATAQDPIRKDVLEMLFQMCDREGLKLVPTLDFSSPLPALEKQRRQGAGPGIALVGGQGRTWIEEHGTIRGRAAYYNPTNPKVQAAMLDVVRELTARYRHHPSFAGIMIGTARDSYALLPGEAWALDDDTMARFSEQTRLSVPGGQGPERFAARSEFIRGPHRQQWLRWRADQIQSLLIQMRSEVERIGPSAKLFIAAEGMYTNPEVELALRPSLQNRPEIADVPLSMGLNIETYQREPNIVLLQPRSIAPVPTAADDAIRRQLNDSDQLTAAYDTVPFPGSLFLHRSHRQRLASFDEVSPFGSDQTFVSLASHLLPTGAESRRRFVHSLAARDEQILIDGGDFLPLGQEAATREILATYRRLPPAPFETLPGNAQPLVVRSAVVQGATYVYVVNNSAWPVTANLKAAGADPTGVEDLRVPGSRPTLVGGELIVELGPYDLAAYRIQSADVKLAYGKVSVAEEARTELAKRIDELVARATVLGVPKSIDALTNPDFEQASDADTIAGWSYSGGVSSQATLDTRHAKEGKHSVKLSSGGDLALLVSDSFAAPETGRLAFSVWLRVEKGQPTPELRLAVGGKQPNGQDYYRFGRINGLNRFQGDGWEHIQFQVDDLPLGGEGELQVRFDLMGKGTVWIDNVQVSALHFSADERTELSRLITKAHLLLNDGRLSECTKLLRGYWPGFLEDHVPVPETEAPETQVAEDGPKERTAAAPKEDATKEEKESWWKRKLPTFLR